MRVTTDVWLILLDRDTMLTRWKKSLTGRRVKTPVQSDGNTVPATAAGVNDVEMVFCKLCLTTYRAEQMHILEQCHCTFCLEVMICVLCCTDSLLLNY